MSLGSRRSKTTETVRNHQVMKTYIHLALTVAGVAFVATDARGAFISLFDYAYNVVLTTRPAEVNDAAINCAIGPGTISFSGETPGSHYPGLIPDHEDDETINTSFNEFGTAGGLGWKIDEPGFVFEDIDTHFGNSDSGADALGNSTGRSLGGAGNAAMVATSAGGSSTGGFHVGTQAPASGGSLNQMDLQSNASGYLSSTRSAASVPEEGPTGALLGLGCLAMFGADIARRRLWHSRSPMH